MRQADTDLFQAVTMATFVVHGIHLMYGHQVYAMQDTGWHGLNGAYVCGLNPPLWIPADKLFFMFNGL